MICSRPCVVLANMYDFWRSRRSFDLSQRLRGSQTINIAQRRAHQHTNVFLVGEAIRREPNNILEHRGGGARVLFGSENRENGQIAWVL
jgi:hypothetical protein